MSAQPVDCDVAEVVWWGTRTLRLRAHAARGVSQCPTRVAPYGTKDPAATRTNLRCREDGCLGILHAVYVATTAKLQRQDDRDGVKVANRIGYARRVVASQVAELDRSGRVARGLPAKPTRTDGVPGHILAAIRAETIDPVRRTWLKKLFRMISAFVCREHRRAAVWPTDMWAAEKSQLDGQFRVIGVDATRAEILDDIATVLTFGRDVAGELWMARNILHPFQTIVSPLPEDFDAYCQVEETDPTERVLLGQLHQQYAAQRHLGDVPREAFRKACLAVYLCEPAQASADVIDDLEAWMLDLRPDPRRCS